MSNTCPYCDETLENEDVEKCPHCGESLVEGEPRVEGSNTVKIVLLVLGVLMLFVCLVIGAAGFLVGSRVQVQAGAARAMKVQADLHAISQAAKLYKFNAGSYPSTLDDLIHDPGSPNWNGPYLETSPTDPWGNPYVFTATDGGFTLTSYGEDGAPGGTGPAADTVLTVP